MRERKIPVTIGAKEQMGHDPTQVSSDQIHLIKIEIRKDISENKYSSIMTEPCEKYLGVLIEQEVILVICGIAAIFFMWKYYRSELANKELREKLSETKLDYLEKNLRLLRLMCRVKALYDHLKEQRPVFDEPNSISEPEPTFTIFINETEC